MAQEGADLAIADLWTAFWQETAERLSKADGPFAGMAPRAVFAHANYMMERTRAMASARLVPLSTAASSQQRRS